MTEVLAYRIVIGVLLIMVLAWARCAQRQSSVIRKARSKLRLAETAVDWLRTHPGALALLVEYEEALVAEVEELSAASSATTSAGLENGTPCTRNNDDDDLDRGLKALVAQLEVENVRDLIKAVQG